MTRFHVLRTFGSGIFEVKCPRGVKIQEIIGPCLSLEKKSLLCSETFIQQGNTSAWTMGGLDKATTLCLFFDVAKDNPDAISEATGDLFYLHMLTCCYQHHSGRMRFRVTSSPLFLEDGSLTCLSWKHTGFDCWI